MAKNVPIPSFRLNLYAYWGGELHSMGMSCWNWSTLRILMDAAEAKVFGRLNRSRFFVSAGPVDDVVRKRNDSHWMRPIVSLFHPDYQLAEEYGRKHDRVLWSRRTEWEALVADYKAAERLFDATNRPSAANNGLSAFSDEGYQIIEHFGTCEDMFLQCDPLMSESL